jgi:hypothetical protein
MFEKFRQQLNDLLDRATPPEDRRAMLARMKDTLVQARMGLDDLRSGLSATRVKLKLEERELETIERRKRLAEEIKDAETVAVATRFAAQQSEKVDVLRRKLEAQEAELSLAEREVGAMTEELRAAAAGISPGSVGAGPIGSATAADESAVGGDGGLRSDLDAMSRSRARSDREAEADAKLAELKRRMQDGGHGGGR